jgi:hypothetical protein
METFWVVIFRAHQPNHETHQPASTSASNKSRADLKHKNNPKAKKINK